MTEAVNIRPRGTGVQTGELAVGTEAYDPVTRCAGVVTAIYPTSCLLFDSGLSSDRVAFLRPHEGGREWYADPASLHWPLVAIDFTACLFCGEPVQAPGLLIGVIGGDPTRGWTGRAHELCVGRHDLATLDVDDLIQMVGGR